MVAYSTYGGRLPWSKGPTVSALDHGAQVEKQPTRYCCPRGHEFERCFAPDAQPPEESDCPQHGARSPRFGRVEPLPDLSPARDSKTHWDYLRERRSIPDLEELLEEILAELAAARGGSAVDTAAR